MICPRCSTDSKHLKFVNDMLLCHSCGNFGESGGTRVDKILTRNAQRITEEQSKHEGDMITPYVFDKNEKKVVPNADFIERYPEQATETFTDDELITSGYVQVKEFVEEQKRQTTATEPDVTFSGDETKGMGDIIG